jgi:hypothetical protein
MDQEQNQLPGIIITPLDLKLCCFYTIKGNLQRNALRLLEALYRALDLDVIRMSFE